MNILLVDDEETILHVVGNFLTACGHDMHPAQDGVEAYEILMQHGGINLVISDIRMPRLDGIGLLKKVLAHSPQMPVLMMTGHGDDGLAAKTLDAGACAFFNKPVRLAEFLKFINQLPEQNGRGEGRGKGGASKHQGGPAGAGAKVIISLPTARVKEESANGTSRP